MLVDNKNGFAILQLKNSEDTQDELFQSYEALRRQGKEPVPEHYEMAYSGVLPNFKNRDDMLEGLFMKFNIDHPMGFTGHSLSVSDIIKLDIEGKVSYHFVDSIGFRELPDFKFSKERSSIVNQLKEKAGQKNQVRDIRKTVEKER